MQLDLVDMAQALAARDKGIADAADHADRIHWDWTEQAYGYLHRFALTHRDVHI